MAEPAILSALNAISTDEMLDLLASLVRFESPSRDTAALDVLGVLLAERFRRLAGAVEIVTNPLGADHFVARFPGPADRRPALLLGHYDTVWPLGTIDRLPFRVENGRAYGPGIYDMKAGLTIILTVLEEFVTRWEFPRPIWVLFTSDEEIGSPTSRGLIERLARECAYALVLEPPLADGRLKTARKGVGHFTITIEGRAAHAGVAPEDGRSAIVELAHQIIRIQDLQAPAAGTTLNVGVIQGGTTSNVVAAHASAEIDVRVSSQSEAARIRESLQTLRPVTADVHIKVTGSLNRPPMERTPGVARLFTQAREIGRTLGLNLGEGSTGGGSDGNFTAALGVPTLDGLGALGAGAHAEHEHIQISSLTERAALLALLLLELEVGSPPRPCPAAR